MKWNIKSTLQPKDFSQLETILLQNRNISLKSSKQFFLPTHPSKLSLDDVGISLNSMKVVIDRIELAKKLKQKVLIFGDYDADGICATAILWQVLNKYGLDVMPFIPHREKHGYGLSIAAIQDFLKDGRPDLVITVDNGIVAHEPAKFLQNQGVDLIITDHHQPENELPPAFSIIHTTKLSGSGVSWILASRVNMEEAKKYLYLAGIATITDIMPMTDANRSFAFHGISELKKTKQVGILQLLKIANIDQKTVNEDRVGYGIGPRINAMGRLDHGLDALRLLCTQNQQSSQKLAQILNDTNLQRQQITYELMGRTLKQSQEWESEKIIIVQSDQFHEGVVGLIAGKLAEKFSKPAIAISTRGDIAKASARSLGEVNIVELLRQVKSELLDLGGHPLAAGFSLEKDKLESFSNKLKKLAFDQIADSDLHLRFNAECVLPHDLWQLPVFEVVNKFRPFGKQNETPLFVLSKLKLLEKKVIGAEGNHLKLKLVGQDTSGKNVYVTALGWSMGDRLNQVELDSNVSALGEIDVNHWQDRHYLQLILKDFHQD